MKRISVWLSALIILFSCVSCENGNAYAHMIFYDIRGPVTSLDPQLASDKNTQLVIENIFSGLVLLNAGNSVSPALCESYTVSENRLIYTFILKDGLRWQNGEKLTADDFVFGFTRALAKDTAAPKASLLFSVENAKAFHESKASVKDLGIKAKDEKTLVITLSKPDPNFLTVLTMPVSMPCNREFFEGTKGKYGLYADTTLSCGPFYPSKFNGSALRVLKNEKYYERKNVIPSGIVFSLNVTDQDALSRLYSGSTDIVSFSGDRLAEVQNRGITSQFYTDKCWSVVFNVNKSEFADRNLRKALAQSINMQELEKVLPGYLYTADGLIPPSCTLLNLTYRNSTGNVVNQYDMEGAKKYYNQATEKYENQKLPKISMIYPENADLKNVVSNIVTPWQTGFALYVNPEPLSPEEFYTRISKRDFQLALYPFSADDNTPFGILSGFLNDQTNPGGFSSADFSKIYTAAFSSDYKESVSSIAKLEKLLITEQCAVIPVLYESTFYAVSKKVSDIRILPTGGNIDFKFAKKKG